MRLVTATILAATFASPAAAQQTMPFAGPYAGVEAGVVDHHYYIETTPASGPTAGRYYRKWAAGAGAFAGYDIAVNRSFRLGLEASLAVGGNDKVATFADGTTYTQKPRYGYRLTGRAGFVATPDLFLYALGGYGGHHYKRAGNAVVADTDDWPSSFVVGAGVEYRLSDRTNVRLDLKHLDNSSTQVMIGVPFRF